MLITHEKEIAAFAKRVVELRDGQVVADRRVAPVHATPPVLKHGYPFAAAGGAPA